MKWLQLFVEGIDTFSLKIAKTVRWLVIIIMSITVFNVVMRYFFDDPTIWAYPLSGLLLGPFWLLGGAYLLLQGGHVRLDMFYRRLTPRKQAILDLVTYTLFFFYCSLILIYGWDYFWLSFVRQEVSRGLWKTILWPFKVWIPVGIGLILLAGIAKYIRDFHIAITGRPLS